MNHLDLRSLKGRENETQCIKHALFLRNESKPSVDVVERPAGRCNARDRDGLY